MLAEDPPHRRQFPPHPRPGQPRRADRPCRLADEPKDKPADPAKPPESEVDARMALIHQRYGKRLDAESLKKVRSDVEGQVRRVELLRKFPLDNGDGPFPVFIPYRAPLA